MAERGLESVTIWVSKHHADTLRGMGVAWEEGRPESDGYLSETQYQGIGEWYRDRPGIRRRRSRADQGVTAVAQVVAVPPPTTRVAAEEPADPTEYLEQAEMAIKAGNKKEAVSALKRLLHLWPDDKPRDADRVARALVDAGMHREVPKFATRIIRGVYDVKVHGVGIYLPMAMAAHARRDFHRAESLYRYYLEMVPGFDRHVVSLKRDAEKKVPLRQP